MLESHLNEANSISSGDDVRPYVDSSILDPWRDENMFHLGCPPNDSEASPERTQGALMSCHKLRWKISCESAFCSRKR